MKAADLYRLAVKILRKEAQQNPSKTYTNKDGEKASTSDVADMIDKTYQWMYKELATDDVELVVRCKRCKYYKKYKKKEDIKAKPFYACSLTKQKRDPQFFCADGDTE